MAIPARLATLTTRALGAASGCTKHTCVICLQPSAKVSVTLPFGAHITLL